MAHWAELDDKNIVLRVTVGDDNEPDKGYNWLINNLGGRWVETFIDSQIRKNYAGIGFFYDEQRNAFIPPKPPSSTTEDGNIIDYSLNEETCRWELA